LIFIIYSMVEQNFGIKAEDLLKKGNKKMKGNTIGNLFGSKEQRY